MTRSKKYNKGSLGRGGTESRTSSWRHRKNGCNGADCGENNRLVRIQSFLSKEYILSRVFRKDGPPLGLEFDPPPANAIGSLTDFKNCHCCHDEERIRKRRKVLKSSAADSRGIQASKVPEKKHGMGKALMTVWRATNSCNGKFPSVPNFFDGKVHCLPFTSSKETIRQKQGKSKKKTLKKLPRRRKVPGNTDANFEKLHHSECKLLIDETHIMHQSKSFTLLVDDEELELMELEAASTPFRCSEHLGSRGGYGCPLCKDILTRFPPKIVKMKQPITGKPWDYSPELVKKIFKVFQFLYNHATAIEICPFTLDDLAQAFRDKDSLLLGKVHVELLKLLLSFAKREITAGFISRASKDSRALNFLHFVREQEFEFNIWSQSLNSLSWTEILRQVLIAAGFGAKYISASRDSFSKERNQMANYGLRPCTLKGELFQILSKQGSLGLKVAELIKMPQIVTLDLPSATEDQEELIKSTLSSDITLFEKIGPAAYRLRNLPIKSKNVTQSEDDDSGSVEDEYSDAYGSSSTDDSEEESSGICGQRIVKYKSMHERAQQKSIECSEIDESFSGEAWVQGLEEGDYSNLSTEEKLDALVALVDLIGACSSDLEGPASAATPCVQYLGSGAKIKRQPSKINPISSKIREISADSVVEKHVLRDFSQTGSSISSSVVSKKRQSSGGSEATPPIVNPLKSIHLGSDRRYNNYWLFHGPCDAMDPGHRRIYFESSEDGHWQVIETKQAFRDLLLALDFRGTREAHLFASLEKLEAFLCKAMDDFLAAEYRSRQTKGSDLSELDSNSGDGSSPNSDIDNIMVSTHSTNSYSPASAVAPECGSSTKEKKQKWDRLQAYNRWIWGYFYSSLNAVKNYKRPYMECLTHCESCHDLYWRDEKHCKVCHSTFEINIDLEERYAIHVATCRETDDDRNFPKHKVLPSQLQALKAAIHSIEGSMPPAAFSGGWKFSAHKLWEKRLRRTSSLPELIQVVSDFVTAINEEWLYQNAQSLCSNASLDEVIIYFHTMPKTISAFAFWMVRLDMLISSYLEKLQSEKTVPTRTQLKGK